MMLGTVRPSRDRSAARVSRGWFVRGVRRERDGSQLARLQIGSTTPN
jgi:hypothetical protein